MDISSAARLCNGAVARVAGGLHGHAPNQYDRVVGIVARLAPDAGNRGIFDTAGDRVHRHSAAAPPKTRTARALVVAAVEDDQMIMEEADV